MRRIFNQSGEKSAPLISIARDTRTGRLIALPGASLQPGGASDWYREEEHKGHLCCSDCDAKVHFFPEVKSRNGHLKKEAEQAHFKTNPGQKHSDDCSIGKRIERSKDKNAAYPIRGYRLNINTLTSDVVEEGRLRRKFNKSGGFRGEEKPHKLPLHEMRYLEPYSVNTVQDIADFISKTDLKLIENSVVVFEQFEIRLKDFLLFYSKGKDRESQDRKFKSFMSRMRDDGRKSQPVLIEIQTSERYYASDFQVNKPVRSKSVRVYTPSGSSYLVMPSAFVNTKNTNVTWGFHEKDNYLVMGIAQLKEKRNGDFYLNVSITSPDQVMRGTIAELWQKNKRRQIEASPSAPAQP